MAGRRCAAAGCGRFVRAGEEWCRVHDGGGAVGVAPEVEQTGAAFRRRLAAGEYRALFGPELEAVLAQAAAGHSLADEIGALRVTLARLLVEEGDAAKLATNVARVAAVAVQAARAQRAFAGDGADEVAAEMARILEEMGKG